MLVAREWGIPILDLAWACMVQDLPASWIGWGQWARKGRIDGRGVHHYRDDQAWTAHAKHPDRLPDLGVRACVECNYSTFPAYPRALALADVHRKRSLSEHWGRRGVKILVDLNVDRCCRDLTLLGVPAGWPSYATRKHRDVPIAELDRDHAAAAARAGGDPLFVVFGGGRATRRHCERRGWRHVPENVRTARGLA